MNIKKKTNESEMIMYISGRMDTSTAPQFEPEIKSSLDGISKLVLDFENLE